MNIIEKNINEITPYENNPRFNDDAVEMVANSIREFGFKNPIIVDKNNVIVAGHTRLKARKKLKLKTVPVIVADDLTEEQIKAFRLADNKVAEFSTWDMQALMAELEGIEGIDMDDFGFDLDFGIDDLDSANSASEIEKKYTAKVDVPQYEITGECPELNELYDMTKTNELLENINNSGVTDEQKAFLIEATKRHTIFNYRNIAEYYAHADAEMQNLMEQSALVIIDFDDAIKYGYVKLSESILKIREEDIANDEE